MALQENVGGNASVTTIAIGEQMDLNHSVMETSCRLQGRINSAFGPESRVIQQDVELGSDIKWSTTDIRFVRAKSSRPLPYISEQLPVKCPQKILTQNISPANPFQPKQALSDIGLFQFVQLTPCGYVPKLQASQFTRAKWRCARGIGKCHTLSHRPGGRSRARFRANLSISFET